MRYLIIFMLLLGACAKPQGPVWTTCDVPFNLADPRFDLDDDGTVGQSDFGIYLEKCNEE